MLIFIFKEALHSVHIPVHSRNNVKNIGRSFVKLVCAFVMHEPCVVKRFDKLRFGKHIFAVTALVSERPENNARAVYISLY